MNPNLNPTNHADLVSGARNVLRTMNGMYAQAKSIDALISIDEMVALWWGTRLKTRFARTLGEPYATDFASMCAGLLTACATDMRERYQDLSCGVQTLPPQIYESMLLSTLWPDAQTNGLTLSGGGNGPYGLDDHFVGHTSPGTSVVNWGFSTDYIWMASLRHPRPDGARSTTIFGCDVQDLEDLRIPALPFTEPQPSFTAIYARRDLMDMGTIHVQLQDMVGVQTAAQFLDVILGGTPAEGREARRQDLSPVLPIIVGAMSDVVATMSPT